MRKNCRDRPPFTPWRLRAPRRGIQVPQNDLVHPLVYRKAFHQRLPKIPSHIFICECSRHPLTSRLEMHPILGPVHSTHVSVTRNTAPHPESYSTDSAVLLAVAPCRLRGTATPPCMRRPSQDPERSAQHKTRFETSCFRTSYFSGGCESPIALASDSVPNPSGVSSPRSILPGDAGGASRCPMRIIGLSRR